MDRDNPSKTENKDLLKQLRNERKEWITRVSARLRLQKKELRAIKAQLREGAGTVPQIAAATGIPAHRVLWYFAALKKYGELIENEKDGSYYRYSLTGKPTEDASVHNPD
jgi:predicted transcriptional regulator